MLEIAFINISLRPESKRKHLPVGLAYVMTAVKKARFSFDFIDMDIDCLSVDDLRPLLAKKNYDVVAFGCIVTGFRHVRQIAAMAKDINPKTKVIAGNSVATSIPELLLRNTQVDILVMGEADITIVELLRALDQGKDISKVSGIVIRDGDKIVSTPDRPVVDNLDTLGFPDWGVFNLGKYNKYANVVNRFFEESVLAYPLNTARGCPFNCTFCYHVFKGKKYRRYSEKAIFEEIKRLHYTYGVNYVSFWDELTFTDTNSVVRLLKEIKKLDFKIGWDAEARANLFTRKDLGLIKEMHEAGCDNVFFALENASPDILQAINKRINVDQFIEQSRVLWDGGVTPFTGVIFGYPQETPETIRYTFDICYQSNVFPSVGFLLLLPGTSMYAWAREQGYIPDEVAYLEKAGDRQDLHINLTQMSNEELISVVETEARELARKQGLDLESVFKTTAYRIPKKLYKINA